MEEPRVCFGFEVHQPFRLRDSFRIDTVKREKDLEPLYFSPLNRDILMRVAEKCYIPATRIILDSLDSGFKCAFSLSGTAIEQVERWSPDALDLFAQAAAHKNCELLGQTYFHSISSLFSDISEFEEQVRMHAVCMHDLFGVQPTIFENTEFILNNRIAGVIHDLGFEAVYTEGADRILNGRSPNYLYCCEGIPVLLRNCPLSDDIAFRFSWTDWDKWPLTADAYARWLALSPGDFVNVFVDYETFGEHQWQESGILEFLSWLPAALEAEGVRPLLPSEIISLSPAGEIDVLETVSWADLEKDTSAWLGNNLQQSAYDAIQTIQNLNPRDSVWRYLQTSDHFYYLATKSGSCDEVHRYFCPQHTFDAFDTYMHVLCHYYRQCTALEKSRTAAKVLRLVPPHEAFHFMSMGGYAGYSAHSLDELAGVLAVVSERSLQHHIRHGDFARWIREVIGDRRLADEVGMCIDRESLIRCIDGRRKDLWKRLK